MKKLSIFLLLTLFPLFIQAQDRSMQLEVQIAGLKGKTKVFFSVSDGNVIRRVDTLYLNKGQLYFNYALPSIPNLIHLDIPEKEALISFWGDNKAIQIKGKATEWENIKISGSPYQKMAERFAQEMDEDLEEKRKLELIRKHLPAPNALDELYWLKENLSLHSLREMTKTLPKELKEHYLGQQLINYTKAKEQGFVQVGKPFLDFQAIKASGQAFRLADALGKKHVLLEFRSTYCFPSLKNISELQKLHKKYGKELEIITVSTDTSPQSWEEMKTEKGILWTQIWDQEGLMGLTAQRYGIDGSPYLFLISPQGVVLEKWFGYEKGLVEKQWLKHRP